MRLAILTSHPIQYQAPLFRSLAGESSLETSVFYCCRWGIEARPDPGFGQVFRWDVPVAEGYRHLFLRNLNPEGGPTCFWGLVNPGIVDAIGRGGFDAVLIHGWGYATNWLGIASAVASRVPLLLRGESNIVLEGSGLRRLAKRALLAPLFRQTAGFLSIGSNNTRFYRAYGVPEEKIHLAPYSVDNARFFAQAASLLPERERIRAEFGIPGDAPAILYCGKFLSRKRPMDLLRAYRALAGSTDGWLLLAGDGELRAELESFVSAHRLHRVRFLGFQNQSQIGRAYVASDVFVLPSGYETWGLVVNEAMCFGLPIVCSDRVGASVDLVIDGHNGFVFPAADIPALSEKLGLLLDNQALRRRMGENSRRQISSWGPRETVRAIVAAVEAIQ